jgi:hypothetical protein
VGTVPGATATGTTTVIDLPDLLTDLITPQLPYLGGIPA